MINREVAMPFIAVVILSVGLLTLTSVGSALDIQKQFIGVGIALVPLAVLWILGRRGLYQFAPAFYFVALFLLLLTFVPGFGVTVNGNRAWLGRGVFQFQPSEFAKLAMILMLSRFMREPVRSLKDYIPVAAIALPVMALTSADLGGVVVQMAVTLGMMVIRGIPWRHFLIGAAILTVAIPTLVVPHLKEYQIKRFTIFLNPDADLRGLGYQLNQAKIAIGSGGLTGKGYKQGSQSQGGFVPASHTDFIFAPWAEEQGFIGGAFLILMYLALFWRMTAMGGECLSNQDKLVTGGVLSLLGFQVFVNLGAALGFAPLTGLTLPLVSYGISSLLSVSIALGMVYMIHRDRFTEF
jgi:rod shape determining protein RodA